MSDRNFGITIILLGIIIFMMYKGNTNKKLPIKEVSEVLKELFETQDKKIDSVFEKSSDFLRIIEENKNVIDSLENRLDSLSSRAKLNTAVIKNIIDEVEPLPVTPDEILKDLKSLVE